MIRVVSIDDHRLFSQGLKAIMDAEAGIELVGAYEDGSMLAEIIQRDKPDVVLLDVHLPSKSGVAIAKEIKSISTDIKVIMLSMDVDQVFIERLESIAVEAYVAKDIEANDLLSLIRDVYAGEVFDLSVLNYAGSKLVNVLVDEFNLTERELEVYEYIEKGYNSEEIADILYRSVWTIRTHRKNIRQKLKMKKGR